MNLTEKIFSERLVEGGSLPPADEVVTLEIDEAFTQDATGTVCMLQLEAMGINRVEPLSQTFRDRRRPGTSGQSVGGAQFRADRCHHRAR